MKNQRDRNHRVFRRLERYGRWTLDKKIRRGGNGEVWLVKETRGGQVAIKLLHFADERAYSRFKIETEALKRLQNVDGVMPLIESFIPKRFDEGIPWLAMPLGRDIYEALNGHEDIDKVKLFCELAETISEIHNQGLSHRDVKPENLLFLNDRIFLSDFGLVKFPGRAAITRNKQDVGPKYTMAPEMRRSAYRADGKMADVFSFSKTLWVILSNQRLGFDGQYNPLSSLGLKNYLPRQYTNSLDLLLQECTDNEPAKRPTMVEVVRRLRQWIKLADNFHERNLQEWSELERIIFPMSVPKYAIWTDIDAICSVINSFSRIHSLCHTFYPTKGGNDVTGASRAGEPGFISLHVCGRQRDILKPKELTFESFGGDPQWNYFRLEAEPVPATGIPNCLHSTGKAEWLTEYEDGVYISREHWENNDYYGDDLPPYARPIVRYLRGSFVFFGKRSYYNRIDDTYDARHDECSEDHFRSIIADAAAQTAQLESSQSRSLSSNTLQTETF